MIDREKVIKETEDGIAFAESRGFGGLANTMRDVIALLKEQEAKAIEYHDNSFTGLPVAHCPNCMRFARQFYVSVEEETHYCPWCGQAVKWE